MPQEAFDLLATRPDLDMLPPVVVLFGEDSTLKSWVLAALTGGECDSVEGEESQWRDIRDEVSTVSLFDTGRRVLVVRRADALLKSARLDVEDYVAKPSSAGRLILELQSCAANTRLYKAADKSHLLVRCAIPPKPRGKTPDMDRLRKFLAAFVAPRHQCKMAAAAINVLIELIGNDIGMLDTEIAKLALYEKPGGQITEPMVREIVGGWRAKSTWDTIAAAASGNAAEALRQLDKMLASGEHPAGLIPQIAWSVRRFGLATSAIEYGEQTGKRVPLGVALKAAGFREFDKQAEPQLRQIGRERGRQILAWLLEADLKLKGSHSSAGLDRWLLEELVLKLAKG